MFAAGRPGVTKETGMPVVQAMYTCTQCMGVLPGAHPQGGQMYSWVAPIFLYIFDKKKQNLLDSDGEQHLQL